MAVRKFVELQDENGEVKKYHAPAFIKGSVARKGFNLGKEFQKLENTGGEFDDDLLDKLYSFIANDLYDGQFTAEEFEDGTDAREVLSVAMEQLGGFLGDEGKTTK
ncbi:hypothetical protein MOV58_10580 [Staphylococcus hominis]|uniref:phage tail assembly chaperone G n=1 Tax=Staphylococcus hominis TaxID=1290 RepID=UPI0010CF2AF0|nr:hypothetical protein [Staphylococcus hominis]TBW91761.1 hypothetical protein EQ808_00365 [Staphylococcus hominis]UNQ67805.1 hypothetical protein MOV58_10580 [Staphylococcus hominis]